MSARTKLVAIGHVSNVTGLIAPAGDIIAEARKRGIATLVDGAQSVGHMPVDVRQLGCDFFAFSGHKMLGPSGIGVLFAKQERITASPPMLFGGGMVAGATVDGFTPEAGPARFEAGTPAIEGALGMGAAAKFLMQIGMEEVKQHAEELSAALVRGLREIRGITLFPDGEGDRIPIASFTVNGVSAGDAAAILCNRYNIMVRSGVHCAEPLLRHFGQTGLVRVSLHVYNTLEEVAAIVEAVGKVCGVLAKK
jgi:cysteine desulfurase/selenocysteine lyase